MNNRKARAIRAVLDLPRIPKMMNYQERRHYRQTKARYTKLPSPAKSTFLDDVTALRQLWEKAVNQSSGSPNETGILNP